MTNAGAGRCPKCGAPESKTLETRAAGDQTRRRRRCDACDHRWSTIELGIPSTELVEGYRMVLLSREQADALRVLTGGKAVASFDARPTETRTRATKPTAPAAEPNRRFGVLGAKLRAKRETEAG